MIEQRISEQAEVEAAPAAVERSPQIAVLLPCYNEGVNISKVVSDFRESLPDATVFVYDNNSTDNTFEEALRAGAVTRREPLQGKGNVVRRMFADIEADIYVMVDGDDTYHAPSARGMVEKLVTENLDMVNGARDSDIEAAYRPGHRFGNRLLTSLVSAIFGSRVSDVLSGYRVFSRRFVKSFPALSSGFETETEFTVHALELNMPIGEIATPYKERGEGSESKLRTFSDGFRILRTILLLVKKERPLQLFGGTGVLLMVLSVIVSVPVFLNYFETGLVPRLPTAVLATGLMLSGLLGVAIGLIMDAVTITRVEIKRLAYLGVPIRWH